MAPGHDLVGERLPQRAEPCRRSARIVVDGAIMKACCTTPPCECRRAHRPDPKGSGAAETAARHLCFEVHDDVLNSRIHLMYRLKPRGTASQSCLATRTHRALNAEMSCSCSPRRSLRSAFFPGEDVDWVGIDCRAAFIRRTCPGGPWNRSPGVGCAEHRAVLHCHGGAKQRKWANSALSMR